MKTVKIFPCRRLDIVNYSMRNGGETVTIETTPQRPQTEDISSQWRCHLTRGTQNHTDQSLSGPCASPKLCSQPVTWRKLEWVQGGGAPNHVLELQERRKNNIHTRFASTNLGIQHTPHAHIHVRTLHAPIHRERRCEANNRRHWNHAVLGHLTEIDTDQAASRGTASTPIQPIETRHPASQALRISRSAFSQSSTCVRVYVYLLQTNRFPAGQYTALSTLSTWR